MPTAAIATVVKMIEALPEFAQERVTERLREYIEDLEDELAWDQLFDSTQQQLSRAAGEARDQVSAGKALPLDPGQL
ncbi:MAG: hypothetical protein GHCLOJNM_01238 [bacterium]|nr:hypothetical protein [bacterium]